MNHEDRLRLIYKPFFITRFTTGYPWSGVNGVVAQDANAGMEWGIGDSIITHGKRQWITVPKRIIDLELRSTLQVVFDHFDIGPEDADFDDA